MTKASLTSEQMKIRLLSDRIVKAQMLILVLDSIKWDEATKQDFFKKGAEVLPNIDEAYYKKYPLRFPAEETISEFRAIIRDIKNQLGQFSNISSIMIRNCEEYIKAIHMLQARGTPSFSEIAMDLYGAPDDAFYPNGPRLSDLGSLLGDILHTIGQQTASGMDEKCYTAKESVDILQERLSHYFIGDDPFIVELSDNIVADAAAGANKIKLNQGVMFSERDLKYLEVHEGWVHIGTTLNGAAQPICTFLSKGPPSSSVTQEGLAVVTEIFTFSSNPQRMIRITNRVKAIDLIQQGANFIDVFRFFKEQGLNDDDSYNYSMRVFRGSTPEGGPFTKDLSYTRGFILIYNYIRLAVQKNLLTHIPTFFVGKTLIDDIQVLTELIEQGLVEPPRYLPPQFRDLAALSSWMCFSVYLNQFDLEKVAQYYQEILH